MKIKRFIRATLVLVMVIGMLSQAVLAAEWYLDDGSITVVADGSGQKVYQGLDTTGVKDLTPVITQKKPVTPTDYTITLKSEDNATVSVTIRELNMQGLDEDVGDYDEDLQDYSLIDVEGDSSAVITVKGENLIHASGNGNNAIVHVGEGSLTIKGDGTLNIMGDSSGAKIGSHEYEEMSGMIHITGDVKVLAEEDVPDSDGAAIGSGQYGDFTGRIQIDGNAEVVAEANDRGAGIGTGEGGEGGGDFRGTVVIGGHAKVEAEGDDDSAGIGSGEDGSFSGGLIQIKDYAQVRAKGADEGPAIGAADDEPMNGTIIIQDYAQVEVYSEDESEAHIGSEGENAGHGTIRIEGHANVYVDDTDAKETLRIGGDSTSEDPEYGSNNLHVFIGKNVTLNGVSGADVLAGNSDILVSAFYMGEAKIEREESVDVVCFYVVDENGRRIDVTKEIVDGTMIITTDRANASLCGSVNNMLLLRHIGVQQIRFITADAVSELVLDELANVGAASAKLVLTHTGAQAALTIGGKAEDALIH